jgi:hypothetical protein
MRKELDSRVRGNDKHQNPLGKATEKMKSGAND